MLRPTIEDIYNNELCHHGIKGQKWGQRRYQNHDGTLTQEGLARLAASRTGDKRLKRELKQYAKQEHRYKKGETIYKKGHTISSNQAVITVSGILTGAAAYGIQEAKDRGKLRISDQQSTAVYAALSAVDVIVAGKSYYENRYLRAYYAGPNKLSEGSKKLIKEEKDREKSER